MSAAKNVAPYSSSLMTRLKDKEHKSKMNDFMRSQKMLLDADAKAYSEKMKAVAYVLKQLDQ